MLQQPTEVSPSQYLAQGQSAICLISAPVYTMGCRVMRDKVTMPDASQLQCRSEHWGRDGGHP
jgi:hypothetical protein